MTEATGPAHRPVGDSWTVPVLARQRRPRVVIKADLLPAVSLLGVFAVLGLPIAFLWSRIAPTERMRVIASDGTRAPLELESWHRFDDLAIFGFLLLGLGVVAGIVAWLLRERRGPVVLLATVAGVALAGWLAMSTGTGFANSHYTISAPPALGAVIEIAPKLESAWVLLAGPLGVALVYTLLVTWNGRDDLGRRLG